MIRRLAVATALATWALIVVGGYVRVTGSGMGCTGWPDCDGRWMPVQDAAAIIEMTHRYVAGGVSLLVAGLVAAAWRARSDDRGGLRLALGAAGLIVFQIGLGAWTVFTGNRGDTVVAHLVTALLLLGAATWAAVRALPAPAVGSPARGLPGWPAAWLAPLTLLLAAVGGAVQVTNGGFSCPELPLCGPVSGEFAALVAGLWPASRGIGAELHMLHRGLAVAAACLLAVTVLRVRLSPDRLLRRLTWSAAGVFTLQAAIGVAQVAMQMPPALRLAHLAGGAAAWGLVVAIVARASAAAPARESATGRLHYRPIPAAREAS